jgi:hypothetical protein
VTSLFQARVGAYLRRAENHTDPRIRGRYYENLLAYLLESVPGCQIERNSLNNYGTEEVDITVANYRFPNGLPMLPELFLIECKNWSAPVDSTVLGYFVNVVVDRGCTLGVLAAANGITGLQEHRNRAYAIGASALVRCIRILVITSEDMAALTCPQDFIDLLQSRNLKLTANGTIFLG